ncbi:MAG: ribose-phosphate pyrophosphokinase [bacterium]
MSQSWRYGQLKVFSGSANVELSREICRMLKVPLGRSRAGRFADGETDVHIMENVRGCDCYLLQPTCPPVNENVMELLITLDALRRASAGRITALIPYYGYGRADRKPSPRVAITAKLVANLITSAGAHRAITLDLHAAQIQGFFDIPVDHLYAAPVFLDYIRKKHYPNMIVVSPDVGGVERARAFAKRINAGLVIIDKRRPCPNEASVYNVIGSVKGVTALILDDMVDTAGTLTKVAEAIKKNGAMRVMAACTHAVLSRDAVKRIEKSCIEEVLVANTIPLADKADGKIKVLSVASILAEAIRRNHRGLSISEMFD